MSSYTTQETAKWVTKGGIDKDWNAYIAKLNQMGLKDYLKIQTGAFDRYQKALGK